MRLGCTNGDTNTHTHTHTHTHTYTHRNSTCAHTHFRHPVLRAVRQPGICPRNTTVTASGRTWGTKQGDARRTSARKGRQRGPRPCASGRLGRDQGRGAAWAAAPMLWCLRPGRHGPAGDRTSMLRCRERLAGSSNLRRLHTVHIPPPVSPRPNKRHLHHQVRVCSFFCQVRWSRREKWFKFPAWPPSSS